MVEVSEVKRLCDGSEMDIVGQAETFVEGCCVYLEELLVPFFEHILFDAIYVLVFPLW